MHSALWRIILNSKWEQCGVGLSQPLIDEGQITYHLCKEMILLGLRSAKNSLSKISTCAVLLEHQLHSNLCKHGSEGHWVVNEIILDLSHSTVMMLYFSVITTMYHSSVLTVIIPSLQLNNLVFWKCFKKLLWQIRNQKCCYDSSKH